MLSPNRATAYGEFYEVISRSLRSQLDGDLLVVFDKLKPVCDAVVARPSIENLSKFSTSVSQQDKEIVQCLHQYLFFPLMSRIKCVETRKRIAIHLKVLETVLTLLERITVNNYDMFLKLESSLLTIIFDSNKPGMISDATEEVKYSTIRCLTTLMLHLQPEVREKLLHTQVPMLAQAVFVAVHVAKLEKLRVLRLAAIDCVLAHTMTHPYYDSVEYGKLTTDGRVADPELELLVVDKLLANILPGVLAALQDVAVDKDNPGHAVITAAIEAIHRILCLPMHNKYLNTKDITIKDFMNVIKEKHGKDKNEVSNRGNKNPRDLEKRSPEWFAMAGEKLTLITKSLVVLRTHEQFKVRKELAVFCNRVMTECSKTMPESVPLCLDVLISLSKDEYTEVSQYCCTAIDSYFASSTEDTKNDTMDSLCNNFVTLLTTLPRILNNIDSHRKISALNLLVGYLETLSVGSRLSVALSSARTAQLLCETLTQAAEHTHSHNLTRVVTRADVTSPPPLSSPWSSLVHLDAGCSTRLQAACSSLAVTQAVGTVLDVLTQYFERERDAGTLWIMNSIIKAPNCPHEVVKRVLDTYLDDELWFNPIEQDVYDADIGDTLDVTVYNPRAWTKDSIPDLYEGTIETRYTDIPLSAPALGPALSPRAPSANAQLTLACLLVEGVGYAALTLRDCYRPYLMKTLCLVLERVGSEYQLLHMAGLKAISDIVHATGHKSVAHLICSNADYITNQITASLKKAWNCESALQILSVVMAYSDATMLDCLYAIVEDVLVQSCDKFYEKNLNSYLQVFLTFLECIQKWYPYDLPSNPTSNSIATHRIELDLLKEVEDYVRYTLEAERLLSDSDCEKSGEELYEEDAKMKGDGVMDYDDTVATEKPPLPSHIKVSISVINRSINFISSPHRETSVLAIRVAALGVLVLRRYEDELLPLVHTIWAPLVGKFSSQDAVVLREACDLLVVLAECSKDFIRSRTLKEILPTIYNYLNKSSKASHLKDVGSSYRTTSAYSLQRRALAALAPLTVHLGLDGDSLTQAMDCAQLYLSNKQPKPLQTTAVEFFKTILSYDYGAAWLHLRALCDNDVTLQPPTTKHIELQPIVGTPYHASDKHYDRNVKRIFGIE